MDTPKNDYSIFQNFPSDIWAFVVVYLDGEQLGRLKLTGAKLLWHKLTRREVVKSINLGQDLFQLNSWPAFLNEFSTLEELSINSPTRDWWSQLGLKLHLVPSMLRKLKVDGVVDDSLDIFAQKQGRTLNLAEHIPHLEVLDLKVLEMVDYSWMAHSPPTLTKLCLADWNGKFDLPISLTYFEVNKVEAREFSTHLRLPPGLVTFIANEMRGLDVLVPLLPPSLRLLSFQQVTYTFRGMSFDQLPRSLTSLQLPPTSYFSFKRSPDLIASLPATLTELNTVVSLHSSTWVALPPNLQKLSCLFARNEYSYLNPSQSLHSYPFETLPRSLTQLEFSNLGTENHFCGPPSESILSTTSYFPPKLTSLTFLNTQLSPHAAAHLPSTLTRLRISNLCEQTCERLPRGLKTLVAYQTLMSPNLIKFLPKSLTSLDLWRAQSSSPWHDYNTGELVRLISDLAEFSVHERYASNISWTGDHSLPPNLTKLYLDNFEQLGDSILLNQQFPDLQQLSLPSMNITDRAIPRLSQNVTSISLPKSSEVSGKCFAFLPRGLTFLNLNSASAVFDCDIQNLPRTLKEVYLNEAIQLTDHCVPDLPRQLELLSLTHNSKITTSSIPHLPPHCRFPSHRRTVQLRTWYIYLGNVFENEKKSEGNCTVS